MFFILKNRKHDVYKKHVLIIFETYLKILKVSEHDFCSTKFREWLSKTIF